MKPAKKLSSTVVYIDGASRGNPGPASIGVVFQDQKCQILKTLSRKIGTSTNNTAEYCALIFALQEAIIMKIQELQIFTDSELLARQFSGEYRVREEFLKILHLLAKHLCRAFKSVKVTHIPREKNKLADKAANQALDEEFLL